MKDEHLTLRMLITLIKTSDEFEDGSLGHALRGLKTLTSNTCEHNNP